MFVLLLLGATLFYPAETCFSKKYDSGTDEPILVFPNKSKSENDLHSLDISGPSGNRLNEAIIIPGDRRTGDTARSQKRKNSDEINAKTNEILRRANELPPLFIYYDIPRDEIDLMENKRKHYSLLPNYLSYPRYFGYKF